ncbi:hypothetical protein NIES4074_28900 [Cylindrospermum sp. NIES-4074]|nr:hypothetical protein NIES4074_28900 [Cylindrospermum sp. NIES-4074]
MKLYELENWVLKIIDQVEAGQPNEDSRVELKSEWIDAKKAARLIAGHANAARGESILWLIGVDEKKGVMGAGNMELANWYPQVESQFDGLAPQLIDLNVVVRDKTIVALLFETDHAPYVVKNPDGGQITHEVPWREGRRTRSAKRSDLIRLLSPIQKVPSFEVLSGTLVVYRDMPSGAPQPINVTWQGDEKGVNRLWILRLEIYVEPKNGNKLIIPFHRCSTSLEIVECLPCTPLTKISLTSGDSTNKNITVTESQIFIDASGRVLLSLSETIPTIEGIFTKDVQIKAHFRPSDFEVPVSISAKLIPAAILKNEELARWTLKTSH